MATQSVIKGVIKVQGVPDSACFEGDGFAALLKALGSYLTVEIPNQTFSNIVISVAQPGQADRDKIWWRLSSSGSFVGLFWYSNNVWSQVFPAPQQIFWLYGSSANPPAGFSFDALQTAVTLPQYTALVNLATTLSAGGPPFGIYPAIYVGL